MHTESPGDVQLREPRGLAHYPLLDALRGRRSRRFGLGMKIPEGPFAYASAHPPLPLSEEEEAALAFAACGVTGFALADLSYGPAQGGSMLAGLLGRTVSSPDAINTVSLVVTNDEVTYLLKRPQDFDPDAFRAALSLAERGELTELYRASRLKVAEGRVSIPVKPGYNFNINKWSVFAPGGTYFLPINEMTHIYINALLEAFDPEMGLYILDERAQFRPAGIARFARSKGGHLYNDFKAGRVGSIQGLEGALMQATALEQGMMLQNLGLMSQALGLGGFVNYALHENAWFSALGFRMGQMPASRYLGAGALIKTLLRVTGRDAAISYPLGLERNGETLLKPYCPPYYPSMREAVEAVLEGKFGENGAFRGGARTSAWLDAGESTAQIRAPSQAAVEATVAYCEYVFDRYGRFPAYSAPFRTVLGYQATHVDSEFYDRFFQPGSLTDTQHQHLATWHGKDVKG